MNRLTLSSLAFILCLSTPAFAQESQNLLSFGVGTYDILDGDDRAADVRIEYRPGHTYFWSVKPWLGAEATTDGTLWGGGGFLADIDVNDKFYVTPMVGAGIYAQGSSDKDLGSPIEFRTQLEGGYKFDNGHRVGVAFGHMSNLGLDDQNPGSETLNLYYHLPVGN